MIAAVIFVVHFVLVGVVGYRARRDGASGITLGVAMVVLLFAIGWTLSTFIIHFLWPDRGIGLLIDSWSDTPLKRLLYREVTTDTASLLLLTVGELFFYGWYFGKESGDPDPSQNDGVSGA